MFMTMAGDGDEEDRLIVYFYWGSQKGTLQIRMARESHVGNQSIQNGRFPAGQDICPKKKYHRIFSLFLVLLSIACPHNH